DFNQNKITDLINFINGAGPNASYSLSNEKEFIKEYSVAFIRSKVAIISFQQKLDLKAFNVLPNGVFIEFSEEFNFEDGFIINLCYNKNALPLIARTRREGDLLYFNYGHKKLKDFYIDEKVPLIKRNKDIIITDNKGEILVVLGRYLNNKATLTSTIQLKYGGKVSE
ncbi:MAG: tRNA lysidine(34) synthetase TilS, partial [Acholeplasmataceae bacterium]|nr:tRNA lysidine(34) synthetase TilS [Acholeplasmataceae bacterium]